MNEGLPSLEDTNERIERKVDQNSKIIQKYIRQANAFKFADLTDILPAGTIGNAEISHFSIAPDMTLMMRALFSDPMHYVQAGDYACLKVDGQIMMSDTTFERATAHEFLTRAHGAILITGLGLGMVLHPLIKNPRVTGITVVENNENVINLVQRTVPPYPRPGCRVRLLHSDAFWWRPSNQRFNTIWHDIWPTICTANLKEVAKLKRRYGQWLDRDDPDRWQGAWVHEKLKELKRVEDEELAFWEKKSHERNKERAARRRSRDHRDRGSAVGDGGVS